MDIAIKDKWLNLEAKCRLCCQLLCCPEHRIDHENRLHPRDLRKVLATLSNNHNNSVSAVKVCREVRPSKETFKTPPTPASTRKRKREVAPPPENIAAQHLLQTLSKKKRRSNILPHLRTPKETPKSPLAIINNGVKSEIKVETNNCVTARKCGMSLMKTSSPFATVHKSEFNNMTPIDSMSPEATAAFSTGGMIINRMEGTPESGVTPLNENTSCEMSDMDISTNANPPSALQEPLSVRTVSHAQPCATTQVPGLKNEIVESEASLMSCEGSSNFENQSPLKESISVSSGMTSPSFQDTSMPLQLNSSDGNFSNSSNRSNLSGFHLMLSPPDSDMNGDVQNENGIDTKEKNGRTDENVGHIAQDACNETSHEASKQDTLDEIFMTPTFNYESASHQDMSVEEFRTPSEWESSTSVFGKYESKTPKCPVVFRTPKVLEHRINRGEEEIAKNPLPTVDEENHEDNRDTKTGMIPQGVSQSSDVNKATVISGTVKFHHVSFEFNNPENLVALLQNPENTSSKRDSGFQSLVSETSNTIGGNLSNRTALHQSNSQEEENSQTMEAECPANQSIYTSSPLRSRKNSDDLSCNISLRDCNMGDEFSFRLESGVVMNPHLNLSDPKTGLGDRFICLNEGLKLHPNINYDRRKNEDLLNCFEQFDVNKFGSGLISPSKLSSEHESSIESESHTSEPSEEFEAVGYIDSETHQIFIPVKQFESELSTIHEASHFTIKNETRCRSEENIHEGDQFRLSLMSISTIQDESYQESAQWLEENDTVKNVFTERNAPCEEATNTSATESVAEGSETKVESTEACAPLQLEEEGLHNVSTEFLKNPATDRTLSTSAVLNYTITLDNVRPAESSVLLKCVSSFTEKIVSLLPFRFTASRSCTVVDLDKMDYGEEYEEIDGHIRRRDPIREYVTTLEMSRQLLRPVDGRAPYYSLPCVVKEIDNGVGVTLDKIEAHVESTSKTGTTPEKGTLENECVTPKILCETTENRLTPEKPDEIQEEECKTWRSHENKTPISEHQSETEEDGCPNFENECIAAEEIDLGIMNEEAEKGLLSNVIYRVDRVKEWMEMEETLDESIGEEV